MRKAAERQARGPVSSSGEGVSEGELKSAAKELGIEPAAIEAALREFDEVPMRERPHFFGGPYHREAEVVFDGVLTEERWEEVLLDIRKTFGEKGTTEQRGTTYEWSGTGAGTDFNTVTLRQTGGSIRMKVTSNFSGLGVIGFMMGILPGIIGMAVSIALVKKQVIAPSFGVSLALGIAFFFFIAIWSWTTSFSRKRHTDLQKLTRDVQNLVSAPLSEESEIPVRTPEPTVRTIEIGGSSPVE